MWWDMKHEEVLVAHKGDAEVYTIQVTYTELPTNGRLSLGVE